MESTSLLQVLRYHEETKHRPERYARSRGYLDWANQPNPFRQYEGVMPLLLPLLKRDPEGSHMDLYERTRNTFWDFTLESVAGLLELSVGLSVWKSISEGNKWALRMNPSSGNLHPSEVHLILPPLERSSKSRRAGLETAALENASDGGVYHYHPYLHALEPRALAPAAYWNRMRSHFGPGFLLALSSIHWRESWKYGERALRYSHHDAGHALAAVSFAANLFGWKATFVSGAGDAELRTLLGFDKVRWPTEEKEEPDWLVFISPATHKAVPRGIPTDFLEAFRQLPFSGQPNRLSEDHVEWGIIEKTARSLEKPRGAEASLRFSEVGPFHAGPGTAQSGSMLIRQRRSAVAMDSVTSVSKESFFSMLDKTLPRNGMAPFDVELSDAAIDLALFVHRVEGLEPGLYWLLRQPERKADLKRTFRREFLWEPVAGPVPLFLLSKGDFRDMAAQVSCLQTIAADGAFSLGMIGRFRPLLDKEPWRYRSLLWEAGVVGQVLYLEAEAAGIRATGIGCFFDDLMHELLGIKNADYQSLYHFTLGGSKEDPRISTLPPYSHLPKDRH